MSSTAKSSNPRTANASEAGIIGPLTEIVRRGMETLVDAQKRTLDLAAQQTAVATHVIAAGMYTMAEPPANTFLQIASDMAAAFVDAHNSMLDIVVRGGAAASGAVKGAGMGPIVEGVSETVQVTIERGVAGQKALLEEAVRQHAAMLQAAKKQAGAAATTHVPKAMDAFRHTMETFVEVQKKLLDLAAQQGNVVLDAVQDARVSMPAGSGRQMADMARRGFEVFVDAQKRVLEAISLASAKAADTGR